MLNSASRSRSLVGRTASDFGPLSGRERSLPPTTRIILASTDAGRPNGRVAGPFYRTARAWVLVGGFDGLPAHGKKIGSAAPLSFAVAIVPDHALRDGGPWQTPRRGQVPQNRRRKPRRSARPALPAALRFRLPSPRHPRARPDRTAQMRRGSTGLPSSRDFQ